MSALVRTATPRPSSHRRLRRVKRGVVAGYIHDISPRRRTDGHVPAAKARVADARPA